MCWVGLSLSKRMSCGSTSEGGVSPLGVRGKTEIKADRSERVPPPGQGCDRVD